ncbi:MAG: GntR family transcriptional regulator [Phycisphaerae bacterium]|nr:GntR family transcriptional regulator [Phycisphaerae bacterium]
MAKEKKIIKHQEIYNSICNNILNGQYQPGELIPTEIELAKKFKASRPTVGRAMRDLEQKGLIFRKQGRGTFVREATHSRGQTLGILMHWQDVQTDTNLSIFGAMVPEMSRVASRMGYSLMLNDSHSTEIEEVVKRAQNICQQLIELQVAGVFFTPLELGHDDLAVNQELADTFDRAGVAVTLLDRDLDDTHIRSKYDIVGVDNEHSAYVLTNHLWDRGCRKIDFLVGDKVSSALTDRLCGYRQFLADQQVEFEPQRVHHFDAKKYFTEPVGFIPQEIIDFVEKVKSDDVDAVMCGNDATAARLIQFMTRNGIQVPKEVKITGFDDLPINAYLPVPLTTVCQRPQFLAYEAVRTLLNRIEEPDFPARDIMVTTKLIIRASSGI